MSAWVFAITKYFKGSTCLATFKLIELINIQAVVH